MGMWWKRRKHSSPGGGKEESTSGGKEITPCEELRQKVNQCFNDACKGKSNCPACQGTADIYYTVQCEGEVKKQAEEQLKNFNCSTYSDLIKRECP